MQSIRVIDSHTAGEPTRVVLEGVIPLVGASMAERREDFRERFDHLRSGIVMEPRGSDVWVGAVLTKPVNEGSDYGVIFFNNAGYLGMCGHGTIGVVATLTYLHDLPPGPCRLDTPVGVVTAELLASGEVAVRNVTSYRYQTDVKLNVEGIGEVRGDIAYGGNWFFLVHRPEFDISLARAEELAQITKLIKRTLVENGLTGADGNEIDHIELYGPSPTADSRNFVLCPGDAYDRSPCGTGTSAKLACLYADGKLRAGESYAQESVCGGVFRGSVEPCEEGVIPTIVGRAYVTADSTLLFSEDDPLRWGLR